MSAHQNEELFDDLESVVAAAARPPVRKSDHTAELDARAKGDGWKVEMYPPLQRLCGYIFNYSHASEPKATRNITIAANRQLKGEVYTTGFPSVSPDGTGSCVPECDSWIDVDWLVAIKAREDQGVVATGTTISEVVLQAADYARLPLSCRFFQLFSVALLVFGPKFMVGIFDRDGVSLSPIFDFCDGGIGFKTFIRVVRRLVSPRLSDVDLGRDPTAIPLRDSPDLHNDNRNLAVTLGVSPDFPPYARGSSQPWSMEQLLRNGSMRCGGQLILPSGCLYPSLVGGDEYMACD
ncbi:hypothetical protein PC9H_006986 [Pleurotus ostreatus]|uniref:Fungal-type protein kinase domain-containing protein n=1 Tax=Pleurotus ostreatus TaxID=5322 RepID=A0A8H7DPS2_PLEOS|nr:uncharacterized protein PC9H_006986 [Pleurotus ostreatus]KAF7427771.1 hypothetical protein PC9H_006986 [Pleurotus ostreatus]KAJ8695741.1 hypothetical protein PTI98_005670 [Pleurotus ostreatus]